MVAGQGPRAAQSPQPSLRASPTPTEGPSRPPCVATAGTTPAHPGTGRFNWRLVPGQQLAPLSCFPSGARPTPQHTLAVQPRDPAGKAGSFPRDPRWWDAGWHPAGHGPPPTRPRRTSGSRWKMTTRPPLSPVASSSPVWLNSTVEMISAGGGETGRCGSLVPQCCAVQHPQRPCAPEQGPPRRLEPQGWGP